MSSDEEACGKFLLRMLAEGASIEPGDTLLDAKGIVIEGVIVEKILLDVTTEVTVEVRMAVLIGITGTAQTG